MAERIPPPRIYRVRYTKKGRLRDARGRFTFRAVTVWVKVPYGALFGLSDTLARALTTHEIETFEIHAALPGEITQDVRDQLERWQVALEQAPVAVRWTA